MDQSSFGNLRPESPEIGAYYSVKKPLLSGDLCNIFIKGKFAKVDAVADLRRNYAFC